MWKKILTLVLCCIMIFSLSACGGKDKTKSYSANNSLGDKVDIVLVVGNGVKVDVDGSNFSISTRSGDVQGKAITSEDIDNYMVEHFNDADYVEYNINGFDCFGFGGETGQAFTHVITVSDTAGVVLVAPSQDAMYDAEASVTFSVEGAVASTESDF